MKKQRKVKSNIKNKDIRELVKARLNVLPGNVRVSIGSDGSFSKECLIDHVEKQDEIGEKIVKVELEFLQAIKKGIFYEQSNINHQA